MTKRFSYSTCFSLLIFFMACLSIQPVWAQNPGVTIKGIVLESGTGLPLKQVSISVASTGTSSETDETGAFTILVPNKQVELLINLPGYNKRNIYLSGRDFINISLVSTDYNSFDNSYNHPLGSNLLKDAAYSVSALTAENLKLVQVSSFDQALQGRVSGLSVIQQSGMPGHKTYMNIRGFSSLYGNNEPLLFIDGMIHEYSYANKSLMEGFSTNPMEVVDLEDISDISVLKDGTGYLGAAGSNGVININTEQKSETSTVIKMSAYEGMSLEPQTLDVLNVPQFKNYFNELLTDQGFTSSDIDTKYPWLNGDASSNQYYRYNNNTDWQKSSFKPSSIAKYHFFLKGGDDIATYNISTGYQKQSGIYDQSTYSRFNLRINGKINISDKFSIAPNAKLSLADSKLPNMGYSSWKNPLISALLMPPTLGAFARDAADGSQLSYLDDVTAFNTSNPASIIKSAMGTNRNYHFLSSVLAQYKLNNHFLISELVGINFNNSRESIFLPDLGLVQVDSARNSPGDFVNEYRSSQNHTTVAYNGKSASGHSLALQGGMRYMKNSYKYNRALDLNTPSDDFKSLGQGSGSTTFLRTSTGDDRGLTWVSYFGSMNYNFRDKYLLDANVSYDGNSSVNKTNRWNLYPSLAAAWRVSSESFLSNAKWLDDLKFRGSWSTTGNMFSSIYDFSKLYYVSQRMNSSGVITREVIPNDNLELEKKTTVNAGMDISLFKQTANFHVDYYQSNVDNLIIQQVLPQTFGYTNYYDNGGKLDSKGLEFSGDLRFQVGSLIWTVGGSMTKQMTEVKSLKFLDPTTSNVITPIEGGEYVTSVGNAVNAFYGYQTNGIINDGSASGIIGPNRVPMAEGDIRYVDQNGDKIIDEKDKVIIGNPNPNFFGGFNSTLKFKNLEIAAYFNYSVGNDIFNYVRYKAESMDSYANQMVSVLNRWRPNQNNENATMPRASFGDPTGNTAFSDRWIEDGSYVRLKQLTINYKLPQVANLYKGITLYVTGTNLLTFTKYTGYDPDFQYSNNPFYMGVDYGKMPQPKSFIVGLKLDL